VDCLTGDWEFVGEKWFSYLLFDGRNAYKASVVFAHLKPGEQQVLKQRRRIGAHWLYVSALRLADQELLIVMANRKPQSGMEAQHPDEFITHLIDLAPPVICEAAKRQRMNLKNPPQKC
jgi:hypothetical protein